MPKGRPGSRVSSRSIKRKAARTTSLVLAKHPECRHARMRSSCSRVIETVIVLHTAMSQLCRVRGYLESELCVAVSLNHPTVSLLSVQLQIPHPTGSKVRNGLTPDGTAPQALIGSR
ncbi:protein of unknown function [Methylorubrum extorquens]|uniref:Uncharacterized protein n=1 Tax=Methylorubrum extorquens TaxID=408 RepID=A0A2N9AN46_METEX|nr:protein of unknown function [Methylorubrum extorquens]